MELIDQVKFTPRAEYAFRHPLIRAVAYESQLKAGRAELHRRLAVAIEQQEPDSVDENAALIAENLEAAGDLRAAFGWHMRAGGWSVIRDVRAARTSWQRARQVADRLPADDPDRTSMQIAPRTLLCGTVWRAGGSVADTGFDELRDLCTAADDKVSLAIGMTGFIMALTFHNRFREAAQVASRAKRAARIDRRSDADRRSAVRGDLRQMRGGRDGRGAATWRIASSTWPTATPPKAT